MSTGLKRAFACARAQRSLENLRSTEHLRRLTIVSVTAIALQAERGLDALVLPDMVTLSVKCQEQVWYLNPLCEVHPTDM